MSGRSPEEQERDIREVLRKAERTPVRTSAQRKDALKRLIDLAHSPYSKLKMIAAENLKHFIKDFPELENDAINAVYDLCEDQVTKVRISGYNAIVEVSREQLKWVKRNADVLVQLLQSDEPDEVLVVKRALSQHLDMDPAVTLGVLCDQVVPQDEPMDEEEQAIRNRLRSLVLSFITGEAKRAIVERHTNVPGSAAEEVLVNGLLKGITKLTHADIDLIVKDILLSLPSFKRSSPRGKQLLETVLDRARASLKVDLASDTSSLQNTRYYLDLSSYIAVQKRIAHPAHLLRFYFMSLCSKLVLVRLDEDAQIFVLSHISDTLSAYEEGPSDAATVTPAEDTLLRKQIPDICVLLLQLFSEATFGERRPWNACYTFLKACQRYKNDSKWTVPSHLAAILQQIQTLIASQEQAKVDNIEDVQSLIRSLLPSASKPTEPVPSAPAAANTNVSQGSQGTSSSHTTARPERRIMNVKRKHEDRPTTLPPRPQTTAPPTTSNGATSQINPLPGRIRVDAIQARQRASTLTGGFVSTQNGQSTSTDDHVRAAKRAKKGGGEGVESKDFPSLLSRLASTPSNGRPAIPERVPGSAPEKRRVESVPISINRPRPPPRESDKNPVGGYSIKGAAKAASNSSPYNDSQPLKSSLLDRMSAEDVGRDMGGQKRRKRTKT